MNQEIQEQQEKGKSQDQDLSKRQTASWTPETDAKMEKAKYLNIDQKSTQNTFGDQEQQLTSKTNCDFIGETNEKHRILKKHGNSNNMPLKELGGFQSSNSTLSYKGDKVQIKPKTSENSHQQYSLEFFEGCQNQSIEKNHKSFSDLQGNTAQKQIVTSLPKIIKKKKILKKRKFQATLIVTLLKYQIGEQTKFYLFADQVVDIEYLKLLANNQEEEKSYTHDENKVCVFKGFKLINQVSHRIDNKCIEILSEEIDKPFENMEKIINMIHSLGDQNLLEIANSLQLFWSNIQKYKNIIKEQSKDELFKLHMIERETASNEMFEKMTSEINQDQCIHYIYFKVDYENSRVFNYRTGYNPKLYELIAGNSYAFKESLLKDGYYDPIYLANRFNKCLNNAISYFQPNNLKKKYYQSKLDDSLNMIRTLDGFFIPSHLTTRLTNLNAQYDADNNLKFKVNDIMVVNVFELIKDNEEENIENQLKIFRIGQKYSHESDQQLKETDKNQLEKQFKTQLFLQKYYPDEIDSLMNKGNKWFKQCGVADIPNKKRKEKEQ